MTLNLNYSPPPIPKLEGEANFAAWSVRARVYLEAEGLWELVDGSFPCPSPAPFSASEEVRLATEEKIAKWRLLNSKASIKILNSLSQQDLMWVDDKESAKEMFEALIQKYCNPTATMMEFHCFTLKENETALEAFSRLEEITVRLDWAKSPICDTFFISKLMASLPVDRFAHIHIKWLSIDEANKTKEFLDIWLRYLESMHQAGLFFSKEKGKKEQCGNSSRKNGNGGGHKEKKCFNCNSPNHLLRKCDRPFRPEVVKELERMRRH